ncbi:MAG TPA: carotenoid biosynthesis protein, partial [Verrucomicrobiae bacterium]|nr:carotenoid biosynthesis protein [Verrucomicrobiae bacterium]
MLLAWVLVGLNLLFSLVGVGRSNWPEAVLLVLLVTSTLFSLAQQLPAQNVLLGALIIAVIGSAMNIAGATISLPFGPYTYTNDFGWRFFDTLPWAVPLIWIVFVLNARGVTRLILRPWRKTRTYGWWVIGFTTALCVLLDAAWEPFATRVKQFWLWHPTKL